ncbi:hypothetical protein SLEP1_g40412 [Rubroshorea leprosula]|nr:hypothetical protein SLEP1_g40412 [Rubroshorea leprosula]
MVLSVDLQSSKCCKKVRKLLCKFPEIRDREYDEKANKVTIKVVSCSPEKIRDKLCCKGGGCIKSIEIKEPPKADNPPKTDKPSKTDTPPKTETQKAPTPPPKDKPVKVSVDVQVQGSIYCKFCSGRPRGPCFCGGQFQCVVCFCIFCSGRPCGPSSCGGQAQCVCNSWCGYGSGCGETQQDCSIM